MKKDRFKIIVDNAVKNLKNVVVEYKNQYYKDTQHYLANVMYKGDKIAEIKSTTGTQIINLGGLSFDIEKDKDVEFEIEKYIQDKIDNQAGEQLSLFDEGFKVGVYLKDLREQVLNEANMNQIRSKQMNSSREQDKRRNARASQITTEYMGISKFGIFNFRTTSQTHPGYFWYQTVECPNIIGLADVIEDPEEHIEVKDIDVLLKANDVMIFCDCLTKGNKILMADGTYKDISEIREGDYVITHNGNKKLVKAFISRPNDENILKISVGGKTIKCTKNHKFLVMNNGKEEWVLARDLTTDMKLLSLGGD